MSKRVNNAKGKPSGNKGPGKARLKVSIQQGLVERSKQERIKADLAAQAARQKVKTEKAGWKDKTRSFFSRAFKQGARGR
jgi:hypothetical protein